ncbi:hypothetical protein GCM10017744_028620 [Streptomyces antimycoticus]
MGAGRCGGAEIGCAAGNGGWEGPGGEGEGRGFGAGGEQVGDGLVGAEVGEVVGGEGGEGVAFQGGGIFGEVLKKILLRALAEMPSRRSRGSWARCWWASAMDSR